MVLFSLCQQNISVKLNIIQLLKQLFFNGARPAQPADWMFSTSTSLMVVLLPQNLTASASL